MKRTHYIGLAILVIVLVLLVAGGEYLSGNRIWLFNQSASATTASTSYPIGSPLMKTLPLGDYKYVTSAPKKGYIYLCHVVDTGKGADGTAAWISGNTWTPAEKVAVEGSVKWPTASYSMKVSGNTRTIKSNDLPVGLTTGIFPIQSSDPAYATDRNPNHITAQNLVFTLPAYPSAAKTPDCIYGEVGIMNDGVELFDGFDAENRDAVAHETQDSCDAHPDESGVYHYHGPSACIKDNSVSDVMGFAFDGYPITGNKLPNGNYLTTNDLDECHGMTSTVTLDGKSVNTYHYVMTQDFPYSVSCFHGTSTFKPTPPSSTQTGTQSPNTTSAQGGTPPTPPQEAISACTGKASGASCAVGSAVTGTCQTVGSSFACIPAR